MSLPNRRRGLVPPPPPRYDPEWENRLRLAMEHVLVPSDFTNSYPFNSPYLSGGRIEVTQISNVTGGPSNVTGDFTKTSPHDEESEVDGSHHWAMRQWRPPSYCGTAYYASPARLPESVSASPNVSGFRLDYDNLAPWSSYDAIADALASTDTKICFQAPVGYSTQATLMGGAVGRVDDEMLAETKSYWQMSLADLRDGISDYALSLAYYQNVSNNASGSLLTQRTVLDVTSPLEAVDNPGAYCTTIRINATAADKYLYSTGIDTWAEGAITTYGRSLLDDANASACRDTLGASSGIWGLAVGGTAADLSATGGTSQFLRQSSAGAAITVGAIAHADLGASGGTGTKYLRDDMSWQSVSAGVTDHGALTGLSDDDHTQYHNDARALTWIGTRSLADLGTRSASDLSSGLLALARGGTNADLSATGGASQVLKQASAGAAITVGTLSASDVGAAATSHAHAASDITSGTMATARLGSGTADGTTYLRGDSTWQTISGGVTDHGALTGLSDDDHSIYALLAGRSGGQTLIGGTASGNDLTLKSTSHATKGNLFFGAAGTHTFDEVNNRWGLGVAAPARTLEVRASASQQRWSYSASYYSEFSHTSGNQLYLSSTGDIIFTPAAIGNNFGIYIGGTWRFLVNSTSTLTLSPFYVTSTSAPQLWVRYDASNYGTIHVGSNGVTTLRGFGTAPGAQLAASGEKLGFYGITPIARPAAYTQTYSTSDRTLAAYTADNESGAYTGIDNAQVGTVYAQLTDLNALRVAYENLRAFVEDLAQHHNSVLDDLQLSGLLQ